ncbi:transposase family protein [Streptacidiphilus pinicola]|uniref:transposase family protein n=1 Tax=Streptacidiphilus pinicola TaxID=2219663 RepID=UPI001FB469D8|nr:transposase family protein [Streptacidiphilus pinicola]
MAWVSGRLSQLHRAPVPDEHPGLLERLTAVPDPRRRAGRRHPLDFVLALAACAVVGGAKSLAAIVEWVADAPLGVLSPLGGPVREPTEPVAPPRPRAFTATPG